MLQHLQTAAEDRSLNTAQVEELAEVGENLADSRPVVFRVSVSVGWVWVKVTDLVLLMGFALQLVLSWLGVSCFWAKEVQSSVAHIFMPARLCESALA